jgi:PTS system mannose-specific IIA component
MVGVLIVSYGSLAEALISSVQSLVGKIEKVKGISIWPRDNPKEVKDRIQEKMVEVDEGDGVLILTDMPRGTPANLNLSSLERNRMEVVTGVNMPMLLTLWSYRRRPLDEISRLLKNSGRQSIIQAKELLRVKKENKGWVRKIKLIH